MKRKSTKQGGKPTGCTERPHLNVDEAQFILDLNSQIVGVAVRVHKLEMEVAELQAKVLVRP